MPKIHVAQPLRPTSLRFLGQHIKLFKSTRVCLAITNIRNLSSRDRRPLRSKTLHRPLPHTHRIRKQRLNLYSQPSLITQQLLLQLATLSLPRRRNKKLETSLHDADRERQECTIRSFTAQSGLGFAYLQAPEELAQSDREALSE
jgi:hypothetical protein